MWDCVVKVIKFLVYINLLHLNNFKLKGRPLVRHYLPNINALIMVLDSNDRERLNEFKYEMLKLLENDELQNSVLLVAANKQDLPNAMKVEELREKLELDKIKTLKAVNIIGTCAVTGEGVRDCFEWISNAISIKTLQEPFHEVYNDFKSISYLKFWNLFSSINSKKNTEFTQTV